MSKLFGLGGRSFAEYLELIVDNDWKDEGQKMAEREEFEEDRQKALSEIPPERRWQYKRGVERFWAGDALRACGDDVTMEDSRQLWRMGWVSALKEYIESRGGKMKCP